MQELNSSSNSVTSILIKKNILVRYLDNILLNSRYKNSVSFVICVFTKTINKNKQTKLFKKIKK